MKASNMIKRRLIGAQIRLDAGFKALTCCVGFMLGTIVVLNLSSGAITSVKAQNGGLDATVSLLNQARTMLMDGAGAATSAAGTAADAAINPLAALYPNDDPRNRKTLRDSISKVSELINNYRQNGLSNMPNLPNLPGLNSVMRIPDKLLRAELSMLQDEIRMAQSMMQNPVTATMNAPRDLASMLQRMAQQLEQ